MMCKEHIDLTGETNESCRKLAAHLEALGESIIHNSSIFRRDVHSHPSKFTLLFFRGKELNYWGTHAGTKGVTITLHEFIKKYPIKPIINQKEI